MLGGACRGSRIIVADPFIEKVYRDDLSDTHRRVLKLLNISEDGFWNLN